MVLLMIMMEKRYKTITDDMYTKGISGYIEK